MPRAGHSSRPTAFTVSYSAASSPGSPQAAIQLAESLTRGSSIGAASRLVMASATAMRPEAGGIGGGQGRALAHAHGFAGKAREVGQGHGTVGHRHLPGADHLVAVRQAAHGAVADGDQEALGGDRRVRQDLDHGVLQRRRRSARWPARSAAATSRRGASWAACPAARPSACRRRAGMAPSPAAGGLGCRRRRSIRLPDGEAQSTSPTTSCRSCVATPTTANGQRSRSHSARKPSSDCGAIAST